LARLPADRTGIGESRVPRNVINSVTAMGWQFPGTSGPGAVVYKAKAALKAP